MIQLTLFFLALFFISVFIEYKKFKEITSGEFVKSHFLVKNQYIKERDGKKYSVLRLKDSSGFEYYITIKDSLKDIIGRSGSAFIKPLDIDFLDYFRGFYSISHTIKIEPKDSFVKTVDFISGNHTDGSMQKFYTALFLGTQTPLWMTEFFAKIGIAHVIALSGYHLAVLSTLFFAILYLPYRYFQDRYFPYRNIYYDLMGVILVLLFLFLVFVDYIPSLSRAYLMLFLGFLFYYRGIDIFSLQTLYLTFIVSVAFSPFFLFSIGFWFSIFGVFYIFLFLKYFKDYNKYLLILGLNFFVYLSMLPIVHYFFGFFSLWQLSAPLINILFVIFYPLTLILHLFGVGDIFDSLLLEGMALEIGYSLRFINLYIFIPYAIVSLLAYFKKEFLYIQFLSSLAVFFYFLLP